MNIVAISTLKNEQNNFKDLIKDLESQTLKPVAWVIYIDDQIKGYRKTIKNMNTTISIHLIEGTNNNKTHFYYRRLAENLAGVIEYTKYRFYNDIDFFFKLDGDVRLPAKDYIERLYSKIKYKNYETISGSVKTINKKDQKRYNDYPLGQAMLFDRRLIDYWKGYPVYPASDTVLNVTADMKGGRVKMTEDTYFIQNRPTNLRVRMSPTVSTAIKHYFLRYPLTVTKLYVLKEEPKSYFKFLDYIKKNKEEIEPLRVNDKEWIKHNLLRLKKKPLVRLVMNIFKE